VGIDLLVGHGVGRERDVEAELISLACGDFDAIAGGDADNHHLRDVQRLQMGLETGVREGARSVLGHDVVLRLPVQPGDEIGPAGRKFSMDSRLLCPTRRAAGDIDQHDWQAMSRKGLCQRCDSLHNTVQGMRGCERNNAFLKFDDDQRGLRVEYGHGHAIFLMVIWMAAKLRCNLAREARSMKCTVFRLRCNLT
jgi:hypothetical protein